MKAKRILLSCWLLSMTFFTCLPAKAQKEGASLSHDLMFDQLAKSWDEGIPLGNGMLGALIWAKDDKLRFSLDRADLWDLRPMQNLDTEKFKFNWVYDQWKNNHYKRVQNQFDKPYDQLPAPSKIPAAALEFDLADGGPVKSVHLDVQRALCEVQWHDGKTLQTFVQADQPVGWFKFHGFKGNFVPKISMPSYQNESPETDKINSVTGQNLSRLGYQQGEVSTTKNSITYLQKGWGGFEYQVYVSWKNVDGDLVGCWSISSSYPGKKPGPPAQKIVEQLHPLDIEKALKFHEKWWTAFWNKSEIYLPDALLEKQWYLEMYKFGSAARPDAPPISLQAVWTADNGKIPPWKGDFHHDLNTELSYWPAYSSNHLDLEQGFINWLWQYRQTFKKYTKEFYGVHGLNVPGVTTLTGEPMGGWIQYSFGPTVAAWLAHHFYLHWRYTMDTSFLKTRAYPWISEVATFLEEFSVTSEDGHRTLPLSSSPEIFNNASKAWFSEITNYDLALIKWTFTKAAELADSLHKDEEAQHWRKILSTWPDFSVDKKEGMKFSAHVPYFESHRHFSHLMAIHPLGLIDWANGAKDQKIIRNSLKNLDAKGGVNWTGYSYAWEGNLKARTMDGEGAAEALRIFASAFCLPNSFHVNGDQSGKGYSGMTYRPFTLEGNFAFAAGVQEMLIQSHTGILQIFPAIPTDWKNVSFRHLRTQGAFLISAIKEGGIVKEVIIYAEKGGEIKIKNPFDNDHPKANLPIKLTHGVIVAEVPTGQQITLTPQ